MSSYIDRELDERQFSAKNGKIRVYRKDITVPVYIVGEGILFQNETLSIITDREAEGIMPYYAISNYGRVWNIYSEKFMTPSLDRGGYVVYILQNKYKGPVSYRAHRLVMLKYRYFPGCEDSKAYEVNHINGDKTVNIINSPLVPDNLEWVTRPENMVHAYQNNLMPAQEDKNKYTDEQIHLVCMMLQNGKMNHNAISAATGVSYGTVAQIKRRKQWTKISKDYDF